jgi:hypothetical protein
MFSILLECTLFHQDLARNILIVSFARGRDKVPCYAGNQHVFIYIELNSLADMKEYLSYLASPAI